MAQKLWEKSVQVNKDIERFTVGRDREMDLYLAKHDVLGFYPAGALMEIMNEDGTMARLPELRKMADEFRIPVLTLIDTAGAYPGLEAEERGQGEAIARNLMEMSGLKTPIIAVNLLPKVKVETVVTDEVAPTLIDKIVKEINTGHFGDGKIFVYDVEDAVRIRTGEHGTDAL